MTSHLYTGALEGDFDPETDTLHLKLQTVSPQRQWLNHIYNLFRHTQEMSLKPMYNPIVIEWSEKSKMFDIETPVKLKPRDIWEGYTKVFHV